jgi:hypothetical protein
MEVVYSCETFVFTYKTARRHNPEDNRLKLFQLRNTSIGLCLQLCLFSRRPAAAAAITTAYGSSSLAVQTARHIPTLRKFLALHYFRRITQIEGFFKYKPICIDWVAPKGGGAAGLQPPLPNPPKPKFQKHRFFKYFDIKTSM